jgi:hypothetical protein
MPSGALSAAAQMETRDDDEDFHDRGRGRRVTGKGGRIAGAGRKRERVSVRRVQVELSAAEDACLTRLEVRLRVSGAEVLRRALATLAGALALLLTACANDMPPIPLAMYVEPDVSAEDAAAYRDAANVWNAAVGQQVVHEVGERPHCGLVVVRGDTGDAGHTSMARACLLHTQLRPTGMGAAQRAGVAVHELGHALGTSSDADHSARPGSLMYEAWRAGQALLPDDIEAVRERLE